MSAYVYLLSNYREDGAEDVTATLLRSRLPEMLESRLSSYKPDTQSQARERLTKLLTETDDELAKGVRACGHDLMSGWGGEQLHVIKLER